MYVYNIIPLSQLDINVKPLFIVGGNDKKLILENSAHPCPKCKKLDTVQLTRSETCIIIFNKRIELPNSMRVRYECRMCHWKNETLPDDDPSYQTIPKYNEEEDYSETDRQNSTGTVYCSVISSSTSINSYSSIASNKKQQAQDRRLYRKHTTVSYL